MLLYALRRFVYLIPVAFGVSLLVFALVHLAPGDPISAIVPPDAPKEVVDKLKEYYGFDQPLPVLIVYWTVSVGASGDPRFARDVYGQDARVLRALRDGKW